MALHTQLPIYRAAYSLLDVITDLSRNMPRDFKTSIGGKLRDEGVEIVTLIFRANVSREKAPHIEALRERLQAVGTVLGRMPMPGDPAGGPMHRVPRLQWKTWVRLAFVEAGSDWRSLNRLAVEDGRLRDYLIVPEYHSGYLGVGRWDDHAGTVQGHSGPTNGTFSIADPRFDQSARWNDGQALGVHQWDESTGAIAGQQGPLQGAYSVADPRPRPGPLFSKYAVTPWDARTGTVIGGDDSGAYAVADPRPNGIPQSGDHYLTGGHYGVARWDEPSGAVSAAACHDNGRWSVADPRIPAPTDKLVAVIRALDGTWHRPFTTLELAALQSLVEPEEQLELDGLSDSAWRERIGNAVPPAAAEAIAGVMGTTLLLAWSGETFVLSAAPIWVQPVAVALSVAQGEIHE
ncbi:MAG TPA: hypothetical protein PLN31_17240 [Azoarcus taiwanensis]|nr:hypothetical protein [Azoarcus taiwanensis]